MTGRDRRLVGTRRTAVRFAAAVIVAVAAIVAAAVGTVPASGEDGGAPAKKPAPPTGARVSYAYDGAGRLVRQGLPDGRVREFGWDRSGNRTSVRTSASLWHVTAKRPAAGAWSFTVGADGSVRGAAFDAVLGVAEVTGTLTVAGRDVAGTLTLTSTRTPDTATYDLVGSTATIDAKSGRATGLTLRSAASGTDGALDARAVRPATVGSGFGGAFRSTRNVAKTSAGKKAIGATWFAPEGTRYGASVVDGGVRGVLLRGPSGLALGVIEVDGTEYPVSGKLKDRSKRVTLRTARGVTPALTLTLAQ